MAANKIPPFYGFLTSIRGKVDDTHWQLMKLLIDKVNALDGQAQSIGQVSKALGANLDAASNKLTNVKDPTSKQDAATKAYVDNQIAAQIAAFSQANPQTAPTPVPATGPSLITGGGSLPVPPTPQPGKDIPNPLVTPIQPLPGPRGFRGDFAGIQIGGNPYGPFGNFFTAFYPVFSSPVRSSFISAYQARKYTHVPISVASGSYEAGLPNPYPAFDLSTDPTTFGTLHDELTAAGLQPVVFLTPDNNVIPGLNTGLTAGEAMALIEAWITPFISNKALALNKITAACVGWEVNSYLSPAAISALCDYCRQILGPNPLLYVHFTPGHNAGDSPEAGWWASMQGVLTGILYQDNNRDGAILRNNCSELTTRFQTGLNGWPTDSGFGHPFDVIAFEYEAFWQVHDGEAESVGIGEGNTALYANPPIQGCCNGLTVS